MGEQEKIQEQEKNSEQSKIKVIHCIPTLQFGGAERLLVDFARYHDREKIELIVVSLVRGGGFEDEIIDSGVRYIALEKKSWWGLEMVFKLWRLFLKEKPDVVHTHLFGADAWGKIAAWFARVPVIVSTEHNTWFDESWFRHKVKGVLAKFSNCIIVISQAVKRYANKIEGVDDAKMILISNGVDVENFVKLKSVSFEKTKVVRFVSIGRLEKQKGFDVLFSAFAKIRDLPWELTVVGNGSLLGDLEDQVQMLGLKEKVSFYGTTDEIPKVLQDHHAFVLASRWEGQGIVIMEAMAAAKPVIVSKVGGIVELVDQGKTGFMFESEDTNMLAEQLRYVMLDPVSTLKVGQNAREYALQNFDVKNIVKKYQLLYLSLLEDKK